MIKKLFSYIFVAVLGLGLVACQPKEKDGNRQEEKIKQQLIEALVAFMETSDGKTTIASADGIVEIKSTDKTWNVIKANYPVVAQDNSAYTLRFGGSTSVEKVAKALTETFAPLAGGFKYEHNHTGSGDAWKRTQGGEKDSSAKLDMGFSSRDFKLSDDEQAPNGTYGKLAIDAIVAVVNNGNTSITNVTSVQLKGIYDGTFTTWNQITNSTFTTRIKAYTRDTTSGTRDGFFTGIGFKDAVSKNTVLVDGYIEVAGNGEIISGVKNDANGIGYISLSSLATSGVKGLNYDGVAPTEANVNNYTYKLTRNFNYIIRNYENKKAVTLDTATIKAYTRDTTSGTRDGFFSGIGFKEAVSKNTVLVDGYIEVAGNGEIISGIKGDLNGIGYISLSSLINSGIKGLKFAGVNPTEANVINGTYKLTRNFNYITRDYTGFIDTEFKKAQLIAALVAYMGTTDGKALIAANDGIVELLDTDKTWSEIKANHPVINQDNSGITLKFGGSTSVEKVAKALSETFAPLAGGFNFEHNHTGSGDAWKRTQGGQKDTSEKLDMGFASRDFNTDEVSAPNTTGKLATDAIVVVVNNENNLLSNITTAQLKSIYDGTFEKWNQIVE